MARAFLLILDSFGIGGAADAAAYGDAGANTLGHIAAERARSPAGPLHLPHLTALGLARAAAAASGSWPIGLSTATPEAMWGYGVETSKGKDTPSGHWELAGVPVPFDWRYFPQAIPTFPAEFTRQLCDRADLPGILGDCHASGTDIIAALGETHMESGKPILYTSADSVVQIAAHEATFGLDRLYRVCATARALLDEQPGPPVGRVIARPFAGASPDTFVRTANRRDFAVPPPEPTLLDRAKAAGRSVIAIGKISDIYAGSGVTDSRKASGNDALFDATLQAQSDAPDGSLVITNFVDFDMLFGHRRDVAGYAAALEAFDARLPTFQSAMRDGDLAVITADHGCDPTWSGTDHTRETVPILGFGPGIPARALGGRGFADVGETLAHHLGLTSGAHGRSWI
jgi:phosphopentomutase